MVSAEVAALCTGLAWTATLCHRLDWDFLCTGEAWAAALCHLLGQGFSPWVLLVGIFTTATGSHFSHWWELWSVCQSSPACVSSFGLCMFLSLITHVCACPFNLETTGTGTELALELSLLFLFSFSISLLALERSGAHGATPSPGWLFIALQIFWPLSFTEVNSDLHVTKCTGCLLLKPFPAGIYPLCHTL